MPKRGAPDSSPYATTGARTPQLQRFRLPVLLAEQNQAPWTVHRLFPRPQARDLVTLGQIVVPIASTLSGCQIRETLPLGRITVIDLSSNIAAPFTGAILADLGADVVHIEPPTGDDSRRMSPTQGNASAYFYVVNRNKKLQTLDLRKQADQDTLHKLLSAADVFITNLRPRKLTELGLDDPSMRTRFPQLITANLNAYGSHIDAVNHAGYDGVIQARTGIIGVTGDAEPARAGLSVLDMGAGMWLSIGVLSALFERTQSGVGSSVATSLFETGVSWSSYHLLAHQISGVASARSGTGHPAFAPYGLFPTSDGEVMIGVGGDAVFERLVGAIGKNELAKDARFNTNQERVRNQDQLHRLISEAFVKYTTEEIISKLRAADVPADQLQLPEDLLHDPAASSQLNQVDVYGRNALIPAIPLRINGEYPPIKFLS